MRLQFDLWLHLARTDKIALGNATSRERPQPRSFSSARSRCIVFSNHLFSVRRYIADPVSVSIVGAMSIKESINRNFVNVPFDKVGTR